MPVGRSVWRSWRRAGFPTRPTFSPATKYSWILTAASSRIDARTAPRAVRCTEPADDRGWNAVPGRARPPDHRQESTNLADILERVLDKGIVIAGDIRVNLLDIE